MGKHIIDIDSTLRDTQLYPNPNSYSLSLSRPLYDVTRIELVSGKIPTTQHLMHAGNNTLPVNGVDVVFPQRNFSNGYELASNLEAQFVAAGGDVDSVVFSGDTYSLTFSNTTGIPFTLDFSHVGAPASLLGMPRELTSAATEVQSGYIDLLGPSNLVLKVTLGADECKQRIYTSNLTATGRLLAFRDNPYNMIDYKETDPVVFEFNGSASKVVDQIHVEWFYNIGEELFPYQFNNRNHIMKMRLLGEQDKLSTIPREHSTPSHDDSPSQGEDGQLTTGHSPQRVYMTLGIIGIIVAFIVLQRILASGRGQGQAPQSGGLPSPP